MAPLKDEKKGVVPKVGAAAFGVALTLPMGLAAPADAMNVCACGGGGGGTPPPDTNEPAPPGPTNAPATTPAERPVSPPPREPTTSSGADQLVKELTSTEPQSPPPARNLEEMLVPREPEAPARPPVEPVEKPAGEEPAVEEPRAEPLNGPTEPAPPRDTPPEPEPEPPARPAPSSGADQLVKELTSTEPQSPPPARNLEEMLLPREPDGPAEPPAEPKPPEPTSGVDGLIKELTTTEPQSPPPAEYLSDLMMPGVDLADTPPPDYEQPRPAVGTQPAAPVDRPKPGQTFVDHYLETLTSPPPPEPEPIGDPPDLRDLDPIAQDEFILSPLSTPFYSEADRRAARDRLANDSLVLDGVLSPEDDRNPERNEFRMEHAEPLPPPPPAEPEPSGLDNFQEALDWGGFTPVVGFVPDIVNGGIHLFRGNWEEAAWSAGGAVPFVGDAAKGVRKGKKIYDKIDDAADATRVVENAADARRAATPGSAQAATDNFLTGRPKIDGSDESRSALDAIFARTASGTRANASHPGRFNPVHTRGHSAELRTLDDLAARSDVTSIRPVPAARGSRTPDFVVTNAKGEQVRVEVTTVTGAPPGRVNRGIGSAPPPTADDIVGALNRKASTSGRPNQFQADLGDVPKGGTLAVHLRGGGTAEMADAAVRRSAGNLKGSGVNSVEIYTADRQVLKYTRQADGSYSR